MFFLQRRLSRQLQMMRFRHNKRSSPRLQRQITNMIARTWSNISDIKLNMNVNDSGNNVTTDTSSGGTGTNNSTDASTSTDDNSNVTDDSDFATSIHPLIIR